jgi:hypothetical protein
MEFLRAQETHPRLGIVGDLGQAVYEWAGATPARLRQFAADQKLQALALTANYRSSKRICAVTHRFCTRPDPDRAEGKYAAAAEPPELWSWERNKQPELVERFRERLAESDIPETQAAVLTWTNALVDRLNGRKASDRPVGSWLLRVLGAAAVERDERMGPTGETFRRLYRAVAFLAFGSGRPADSTYEQQERIRTASAQLLGELPKVEGELRAWNLSARDALGAAATAVSDGCSAAETRSALCVSGDCCGSSNAGTRRLMSGVIALRGQRELAVSRE